MSSNCSLVTGPGMSSSSICAESCGRAALPLAAAVLNLRGMKTPLVECYASHTKFLTGSLDRNLWAEPGDLNRYHLLSRCLVAWCEFSARLFALLHLTCS